MSKLLRVIIVLGLVTGAALIALGIAAHWFPALDIVNNGLPFLALGGVVLLALAFAVRQRSLITAAAAFLAVTFALLLSGLSGAAPQAPGERGTVPAGRDVQPMGPQRPPFEEGRPVSCRDEGGRRTFTKETGLGRFNTFYPTWPMRWRSVPLLPLLPIDNVFASRDFAKIDTKVGPRLDSDHRPVIADIALIE